MRSRSDPRGATMFTEMPASVTGAGTSNEYDDPRMEAERFHEHGVEKIETGVAVGGYDNDSLPDIFVVSKVRTYRQFHCLGGWKFEDGIERAHSGDFSDELKQGASFVDVNKSRFYVGRCGAPNLLFINQRDGSFREGYWSSVRTNLWGRFASAVHLGTCALTRSVI
jgi:hypothetical protein